MHQIIEMTSHMRLMKEFISLISLSDRLPDVYGLC